MSADRHIDADVVVVGGGLAGLSCAYHLRRAEPEARVLLLERDRIGAGASGAPPGLAVCGIGPDVVAVLEDHDEAVAIDLDRLSRANRDLLLEFAARHGATDAVRATTTRRTFLPAADRERRLANVEWLGRAGEAARVDGDAIVTTGDLWIDAPALLRALAAAAEEAGAIVRERTEVTAIESSDDGAIARTSGGGAAAVRVVMATGAWLPKLDAWTREVSLAARAQWIAVDSGADAMPGTHGPGFAVIVRDSGGWIAAEGTAPSNRGDPFDGEVDPMVATRLLEFARATLASTAEGRGATSTIATRASGASPRLYTCDGRPLIGPHPGRAACVLAAGFNGQDASYGFVAGLVAAEWITRGTPSIRSSYCCSPRRLL